MKATDPSSTSSFSAYARHTNHEPWDQCNLFYAPALHGRSQLEGKALSLIQGFRGLGFRVYGFRGIGV